MPHFATHDGIKLAYHDEGDGPSVLFLHGFTSSTDGNWRQPGIWDAVLACGTRVIGLDARGHGDSDKPHDPSAYENQAMVRDVAALVDHLDLHDIALIGYSMGAATAVRFAAADSRLRRLVLGGIGGRTESWKTPAADPGRAKLANKMRMAVRASDPATIEDRVARRVRRLMVARNNDIAAMSAILHADRAMGDAFDPAAIAVPTLVVCGDEDVSPERLAAAIPRGEAAVLPGDHEGVVITPEFRDTIVRFLAVAPR